MAPHKKNLGSEPRIDSPPIAMVTCLGVANLTVDGPLHELGYIELSSGICAALRHSSREQK